ncbi:MAG: hypothetical protein Q4C53_08030 [Clostridia bacterium]|nr:hypothetical protein [Clostridia bacterium]
MARTIITAESLIAERDRLRAELEKLQYSGMPEVKTRGGKQYLYTRRRIDGRLTSTYIGPYSNELFDALKENGAREHDLRISLRRLEKKLAGKLTAKQPKTEARTAPSAPAGDKSAVWLMLAKKRRNALVANEAPLAGITADRRRVLALLNNGTITGIPMQEVGQVMALSRAWDAVLEPADNGDPLDALCRFGRLIGGRDGGKLRIPVDEEDSVADPETVRARLSTILGGEGPARERAVALFLYCVKARILETNNDCAALLLANRMLIPSAGCALDFPPEALEEFRTLRAGFIEGNDRGTITRFLYAKCVERV